MRIRNLLHLANIAIVITTLFTAMLPGSAVAQETPQQPQGTPSEAGDVPVAAPQEVAPPVVETAPVIEQVTPIIDSATPTPAVETPPPSDAIEPPSVQQAEQPNAPRRPATLTIATWGGAYGQAQNRAIFSPYEKTSGDQIEMARYDGTLASVQKQGASASSAWDVVDVNSAVAAQACEQGLLEPLDAARLLNTGDSGEADFISGAIKPCAVGSVAWSAVMIYNKNTFAKRIPVTLKDLFDLKGFPGKRALPKGPKYNLEIALMADGVEPAAVYETLATAEGLERAFRKLDQIKKAIVWWDIAATPVSQVGKAEAAMGIGFNGRAFHAMTANQQPIGVIWDGQIYDMDYWAIPKGAQNLSAALDFIRFASAPERLAAQTRYLPYGPVRVSALAQVGKHSELNIDMKVHLPTTPENMKRALAANEDWWRANEADISEAFNAWLLTTAAEDPVKAEPQNPRGRRARSRN
ncbi:MAG: extracellular solute-binding protein [Chitinophagales bacterium]|nr:extracellular solute-binding protein [Hyphomicrobiales bacterium]